MNTKYMYDSKWRDFYVQLDQSNFETKKTPRMKKVEQAILLPSKGNTPIWGVGGALDSDMNYVEESGIKNAFGGKYNISKECLEYVDCDVIFIPIIPKHWGHFLIDALSRFWFFEEYSSCPIYYCGWNWEDNEINTNYLEALEKLGVNRNQLHFVDKPIVVRTALIPERSFGFGLCYHNSYKKIIETIVSNVNRDFEKKHNTYKKIYFTRRKFYKSQISEVGEKEIETVFKNNGYEIIAPELLSFAEQVYIINHADEIVCMSGTIPHNIIFKGDSTKLIIINRTSHENLPQFAINQMFGIENVYVDCYHKTFIKHPVDYGQVPLWIEINTNFKEFCKDKNIVINYSSTALGFIQVKNFIIFYSLKIIIAVANKLKKYMPTCLMKKIRT